MSHAGARRLDANLRGFGEERRDREEKIGEGEVGRGRRGVVDGEREGKNKPQGGKTEQCPLNPILTPVTELA